MYCTVLACVTSQVEDLKHQLKSLHVDKDKERQKVKQVYSAACMKSLCTYHSDYCSLWIRTVDDICRMHFMQMCATCRH